MDICSCSGVTNALSSLSNSHVFVIALSLPSLRTGTQQRRRFAVERDSGVVIQASSAQSEILPTVNLN